MNSTNENASNSCYESVGTSIEKLALAYLFSEPKLQLVELNQQEYMEGQIIFFTRYSLQQKLMLEATIKALKKKMSSRESYAILSVGCGTGIFEKPFLQKLLEHKKFLYFVGIDCNEIACARTQEWCQKISKLQPDKFGFKIALVEFESFQSRQSFDIILLSHSLYYLSEIETSIRKVYELLKDGGMAIFALAPKRSLLNQLYYHINQRLNGKPVWFSEDFEKILIEYNFQFRKDTREFLVNITECFQKESKLGKQLLDFIIGANTSYFSPLQLRLFLDYFETVSQKTEGGEIVLPHFVNLFYLDKDGE